MSEEVYDEQVAPLLLKAGEICKASGMSMVCAVEYESDAIGETSTRGPGAGISILMADAAVKSRGNVDRFLFWAIDQAKKSGHSSVMLTVLESALGRLGQ